MGIVMNMLERCFFDRDLELSRLNHLVVIGTVLKFSLTVESIHGVLVGCITVCVLETSVCKVALVTLLKVTIMISLGLGMGQ